MANTGNQLFKSLILDGGVYENFINSTRTEKTKELYDFALKKFMLFRNVNNITELLPSTTSAYSSSSFIYSPADMKKIESDVASWINHLSIYYICML